MYWNRLWHKDMLNYVFTELLPSQSYALEAKYQQ